VVSGPGGSERTRPGFHALAHGVVCRLFPSLILLTPAADSKHNLASPVARAWQDWREVGHVAAWGAPGSEDSTRGFIPLAFTTRRDRSGSFQVVKANEAAYKVAANRMVKVKASFDKAVKEKISAEKKMKDVSH
jgi:hypothetical protein